LNWSLTASFIGLLASFLLIGEKLPLLPALALVTGDLSLDIESLGFLL